VVPPAKRSPAELSSANFVFEGTFEGRTVCWHCHLVTLASVAQQSGQSSQRQFIEIESLILSTSSEIPSLNITVGLNLPVIDAAAIRKTSIMIRNYKRLHGGRHEYGETFQFALD